MSLADLSPDVLGNIFGFLDQLRDAANLAATCAALRVVGDKGGWKNFALSRWGIHDTRDVRGGGGGGGVVRVYARGLTIDVPYARIALCLADGCAIPAQCLALRCRGPYETGGPSPPPLLPLHAPTTTTSSSSSASLGTAWDHPRGSWRALGGAVQVQHAESSGPHSLTAPATLAPIISSDRLVSSLCFHKFNLYRCTPSPSSPRSRRCAAAPCQLCAPCAPRRAPTSARAGTSPRHVIFAGVVTDSMVHVLVTRSRH
jgi:hypothetical protein